MSQRLRQVAVLAVAAAIAVPAARAFGQSAGSDSPSASGSAGSSTGSSGGSSSPGRIIQLPVDSAAPDVSAAASPTVVRLGAHFTLFIRATFSPGVEVNLREPLELGSAFEVRRRLSEDRPAGEGRTIREWQLDVMPWELGELQIAPIAVTFTAFGRAGQVATNAVPLKITGDLSDAADLPSMRGLAAPTSLWVPDWLWIWIATGGAIAIAIAIIALRFGGRRKHALHLAGGSLARPARVDMTGERALEQLLAIERSGALDRDADRKTGYAEMVSVIRDYLAARYRIATHELTSSELLARLAAAAAAEQVAPVASWLDGCDLVKYGGMRASPAEAGKALDDARALIVTTTEATTELRGRKEAA